MTLPILSYSKIRAYENCPAHYYLEHVARVSVTIPATWTFGKNVHAAIESLARPGFLEATPSDALDALEHNWSSQGFESDEEERAFKARGAQLLQQFLEFERESGERLVFSEKPFSITLEGVTLKGRMDAVFENNGAWEVVDFKTGPVPADAALVRGDLQLRLYSLAVQTLYYKKPRASLHYLSEGVRLSFDYSPDEFTHAKDRVKKAALEIAAERFDPAPGEHCRFCPVREHCEANLSDD